MKQCKLKTTTKNENYLFSYFFLSEITIFRRLSEVLTISGHAQGHALLQPAELAPVPVHSVHHAVLLAWALVVRHARLGSPEETLKKVVL